MSVDEQFAISISIVPLLAAGLVTPGYIILFMVSRFTTGRPSFASSLAVSCAYYVVVWAVCDFGSAVDVAERVRDFDVNWQVAMIVVGAPAAIGVLAGLAVQKEWIYHVLRFVKLEPVHGIPSAWASATGATGEGAVAASSQGAASSTPSTATATTAFPRERVEAGA